MDLAVSFDRKVIFEQGIEGVREIECSVLGNDTPMVSVCGEVVSSNEFYDYDAKYVDGASRADIPAHLPTTDIRTNPSHGPQGVHCPGLLGYGPGRDFFLTRRSGTVYINELNTIPGFTSISMYPKLWEASGMSFSALLERLIELAMQRHGEKSRLRHSYDPSAAWYR